jgi:SAM-dependent methyltransferase
MNIDHSLTYTTRRLKNVPHQLRLNRILKELRNIGLAGKTFADVGCGNGYITNIVRTFLQPAYTAGYDVDVENIRAARNSYPEIDFKHYDFSVRNTVRPTYDVVACFETLEHVVDVESSLDNLCRLASRNGIVFVTVPIEIGPVGIIKYLAKTVVYRYDLDELGVDRWTYFKHLVSGGRVSIFRNKTEGMYGSHFGFDYRKIDAYLSGRLLDYRAYNYVTTRFYLVRP